jgi:hypothetical protein
VGDGGLRLGGIRAPRHSCLLGAGHRDFVLPSGSPTSSSGTRGMRRHSRLDSTPSSSGRSPRCSGSRM